MFGKFCGMIRYAVMFFAVVCACSACTNNREIEQDNSVVDCVYVGEKTEIENAEFLRYPILYNNRFYYMAGIPNADGEVVYKLYSHDLSNEQEIIEEPVQNTEAEMSAFCIDSVGSQYVVWNVSTPAEDHKRTSHLVKYDDGEVVYRQNIGNTMSSVNNQYISKMVADDNGRVYILLEKMLFVFNEDGLYEGCLELDADVVVDIFVSGEGAACAVCQRRNATEVIDLTTNATMLHMEKKNDIRIIRGMKEDRLWLVDSETLREYCVSTEETVTILKWLDCNIQEGSVREIAEAENGDIVVYCENSGKGELVFLKEAKVEEMPKRETLILASVYGTDPALQEAVVKFNQSNQQYQVEVKTYIDVEAEWTESTYSDAVTRLQADLVSADTPDILDLSSLDWENLAAKEILEDLNPYLENSKIANKADFVPNVLAAYQTDGKQVTVPKNFNLRTLIGKKTVVGTKMGWTLSEMISVVSKYPDSQIMAYVNPRTMLNICLPFAIRQFVDYDAGTCKFDSLEFIEFLNLVSEMKERPFEDVDLPTELNSGKLLLCDAPLTRVKELQMYREVFGEEITCIGFPNVDGIVGVFLNGYETYGIVAKSKKKEGAWEFVESVLEWENLEEYYFRFPTRTDMLNELFALEMAESEMQGYTYNGLKMELGAATQEEIDTLWTLIHQARLQDVGDEMIMSIIQEETQAYFLGQKSVEDVASIIQNRVSLYMSESYEE